MPRRTPPRRFLPRPEVLEARSLPAIFLPLAPTGTTLTIVAQTPNDTVDVEDDGNQTITVVPGDGPERQFTGVNTINVFGSPGNDLVTYHLRNDLAAGVTRTVNVALGAGNDKFVASVGGNLLSGLFGFPAASLTFNVNGGAGRDVLSLLARNVNVGLRSSLTANLNGQAGRDRILVDYSGELDGTLNVQANGGDGNDVVQAFVDTTPASTGTLGIPASATQATTTFAQVRGGAGDDDLTFVVHARGPGAVFAQIRGDDGRDVGRHTANVSPFTLERDILLM
jgi:hypothetical protein